LPLRIVPSKLKIRAVTSGVRKLSLLNTLKASTIGSIVRPDTWNSFESRRSSDEYLLSLRPLFRVTMDPSARMRSEGPATIHGLEEGVPSGFRDWGCAERKEYRAFTLMSQGACHRNHVLNRCRWSRSEKPYSASRSVIRA
jgi:hypothetical protein